MPNKTRAKMWSTPKPCRDLVNRLRDCRGILDSMTETQVLYIISHLLMHVILIWEIINGALVLLKNYNGTELHFSGTPQLYGNYNRDLNDEFSVKCPLNLEFNLTMVSFFIFFPFLFHGCSSSMAALLPWLVWN